MNMHICKNKYGVSKEKPIDLKIENLDRVSIPAKSVATFDIRHPIHGTTYGVRPRSAFQAVSVHFSLCWAI